MLDMPAKKFNGMTELLYGETHNKWQFILDGLAMMINGIVIDAGLYARAIPYTSP